MSEHPMKRPVSDFCKDCDHMKRCELQDRCWALDEPLPVSVLLSLLADAQQEIADLKAQLRIEPLHGPKCPYQPYEDSYDAPEGVDCTCDPSELGSRWKARAVVERGERRLVEAQRDTLRQALEQAEADIADMALTIGATYHEDR